MTEKICIRCLESKPLDRFSKNTARCHPCRAEASKLNVADHRQRTEEYAANQAFSALMRNWIVPEQSLLIK